MWSSKLRALRRTLEEPNAVDSFRTLIEQVIEDALTGGFGAIEMEADRRSGTAGDAVARRRRFDPHQPAVGRTTGLAALCAGRAGANGVERGGTAATTS